MIIWFNKHLINAKTNITKIFSSLLNFPKNKLHEIFKKNNLKNNLTAAWAIYIVNNNRAK